MLERARSHVASMATAPHRIGDHGDKADLTYWRAELLQHLRQEQKHADACGVEAEIVQRFTVKVDSLGDLVDLPPGKPLLVHLRDY